MFESSVSSQLVDQAHLFLIGYQSSYFSQLLFRSNMQQNLNKTQENNSIEQNAFEGWKL